MNNTSSALRQNLAMIVLLLAFVTTNGFSAAWNALSGERWFRDMTMQTPFHGVTAEIEPVAKGIAVRGVMVKRRCQYRSLRAYALMDGGLRIATALDLSPETAVWGGGSRPPSDNAEAWGPWIVSTPARGQPSGWEIYAYHLCPDGEDQVNLFASGAWPATN